LPDVPEKSAAEKEGVERNSFRKRHTDDGLHKYFTGCTRVAANGLNCFHANKAHPDSGGGTANGSLESMVEITFNYG
jgi:hypothetical protein